jgi:adenosylcobyric acid synthase
VEGAGGAAEVNLYSRDIANIRLAQTLKMPIILVADIERGGVFASVYGTIQLLPPEVRELVRGIIINKFRGDPGIFSPGTSIIEELTGIPVLGMVPYCDIPLPSEDSLSLGDKKAGQHPVHIAILRLPHISNFTDFELLEQHAAVNYVTPGEPLGGYDCIIIPGTKNTIEDLLALNRSGGAEDLKRARNAGVPIIGIFGGYQMLGRELHDSGVESHEGVYEGLGLLSGVTKFIGYDKNTTQVRHHAKPVPPILSMIGEVTGYEIHMGITDKGDDLEAFDNEGAVSPDGLVIGTYMHGLLSNPPVINALLSYLYHKKGEPFVHLKERSPADPYDQLAQHFEEHVDMKKIIEIFTETKKQ